jgi:hypothetical protein
VKVKDEFLNLGHFCLNNGCNISFWGDKWLGNYPLKELYPSLFAITRENIFQLPRCLVQSLSISLSIEALLIITPRYGTT